MSPETGVPKVAEPTQSFEEQAVTPVLEAVGLSKSYLVRRTGREDTRRGRQVLHAFDNVSFALYSGRVTALVGESGSGKSTVARVLAQLETQTSGRVLLRGAQVRARRGRALRRYVRDVQIVFQDPFSSLNPTRTVRYHLTQPLRVHHRATTQTEATAALESLLDEVSLTPPRQFLEKFPHELSGGQRQRVAVARALARARRSCWRTSRSRCWTSRSVWACSTCWRVLPRSWT